METNLIQQANTSPDAIAVVDGNRTVSYRELIARADMLADILEQRFSKPEQPTCLLVDRGLAQTVAQVAVLRAGGSCVPIDPSVPSARLKGMLDDLSFPHIVASNSHADVLHGLDVIPIETALEKNIDLDTDIDIPMRAGCPDSHRSHIIFTSRSTGRPKPIQVLSSNILHALRNFPIVPRYSSDRVTGLITPGFDLSLLEIWGTLLAGATLTRVPDLVRTDPFALQEFVQKEKISIMIIPTALFHVVALSAPSTFRGLRHVTIGGEPVTCNAVRKVLATAPPENIWNGYGPAEATIFATICRVDEEEAQHSRIGIGQAVGDTKIYLLDEQQKPITEPAQTGEICIAGPQLSPGYLNRPEENDKSFILLDAAAPKVSSHSSLRLYRTGDLGQWRDHTGHLDYIGRADDQVKISGYRVELGDIARTMESNPDVHSCVVIYTKKEDVDLLDAYAIPADWEREFDPKKLCEWVKQKLPPYMVPNLIHRKRSFPLLANGKVDRRALRPDEKPLEQEGERQGISDHGKMKEWLAPILKGYFRLEELKPTDNFFSLGLTSLQAAQLIGRIRRDRGANITLAQLHSHPTIESLIDFLDRSEAEYSNRPPSLDRWELDAKLLSDATSPPDWQALDEGRIFLTGATGFVGAHLLHQLLSKSTVKKVACLVRGRGNLSASDRIQQTLEQYDLWDDRLEKTQKIMVLEGDLTDPRLGLGEENFAWLTNWASVIFHVGAKVNWCEPYETHYEPNVLGTLNIIRATMLGRCKALHYVSSIDVWTVTGFINGVDRVYEDEPLGPHLNALPYDTGYSQSQWVAEELVQQARSRGLSTAIYRPGFVIGHSEKAIGNATDFFSRLIVGSIQSGYFPYLPSQRLDYVTVDYVCTAILHIASNLDNIGRAYHIVPPDRSVSVDHEKTYSLLRQANYPVEKLDYREWVEKIRSSPGNALEPMMPLLDEPVHGDLSRLQTSRDTPVYDPSNTARALKDRPDIAYVALDQNLLQLLIHNWVERDGYSLGNHCRKLL